MRVDTRCSGVSGILSSSASSRTPASTSSSSSSNGGGPVVLKREDQDCGNNNQNHKQIQRQESEEAYSSSPPASCKAVAKYMCSNCYTLIGMTLRDEQSTEERKDQSSAERKDQTPAERKDQDLQDQDLEVQERKGEHKSKFLLSIGLVVSSSPTSSSLSSPTNVNVPTTTTAGNFGALAVSTFLPNSSTPPAPSAPCCRTFNYAYPEQRACWAHILRARQTQTMLNRKMDEVEQRIMLRLMSESAQARHLARTNSTSASSRRSFGLGGGRINRTPGVQQSRANENTSTTTLLGKNMSGNINASIEHQTLPPNGADGGGLNDVLDGGLLDDLSSDENDLVVRRPGARRPSCSSKPPPPTDLFYRGSCLCGHSVFEAFLFPPEIQHCYCSMCRRFSGSAFQTWAPTQFGFFKWVEAKDLKVLETSRYASRHVCKRCGTHLTIKYDSQQALWLAMGAFDFAHENKFRKESRAVVRSASPTKKHSRDHQPAQPIRLLPAEEDEKDQEQSNKGRGQIQNHDYKTPSSPALEQEDGLVQPAAKRRKLSTASAPDASGWIRDVSTEVDKNKKTIGHINQTTTAVKEQPVDTQIRQTEADIVIDLTSSPSPVPATDKIENGPTKRRVEVVNYELPVPEMLERPTSLETGPTVEDAESWVSNNIGRVCHICVGSRSFYTQIPSDNFEKKIYAG
ncbi:unnamed protein product [Amoebophrya sp. A25]|nr:unnamed protein product [Amoebophrya sp. A25]|eukprot:GSA25T00021103001.1